MSPIQKEKHITKDDVGALHTAYPVSIKIKYHLQSQEGKERNQELERPPSRSGGPVFFLNSILQFFFSKNKQRQRHIKYLPG